MTKIVRLKLVRVKYTGDSIGDDIRIEIEAFNSVFALPERFQKVVSPLSNASAGMNYMPL